MDYSALIGTIAAVVFLLGAFGLGYFVLATRRIAADAERCVPPVGKFVQIGGNRIHYVEAGHGPPLLLLHGLGATLMQFRQTLLDDLAQDFRVIAIDRPGAGYSMPCEPGAQALEAQADTISRFLAEVGMKRPLVVGHSLGGAVALALAAHRPDAVRGLVLLAPLTQPQEEIPPQFASLYVASAMKRRLLAHTIAVPMALKAAQATLAYVFSPQKAPRDYMVAGGGLLGLRPSHIEACMADFVAAHDGMAALSARYGGIDVPVGVLFGTADNLLDPQEHGGALPGVLPDCELEYIDGAGHMLPYAVPDTVLALIRRVAQRAPG